MDDFPKRLKRMGYDRHGHRARVRSTGNRQHLMKRFGMTPCWDHEAAIWHHAHGVVEIVAHLTDGREMRANLERFLETARVIEYPGQGKQFGSSAPVWTTTDPRALGLF